MTSAKSAALSEYRKKLMALQSKIKGEEKTLKELKHHVEQGTIPKSMKITPIPKMKTLEGQEMIRKDYGDLEMVVLCHTIHEREAQLKSNLAHYQTMKEERNQYKSPPPQKLTKIALLQAELEELKAKYIQLCNGEMSHHKT